MFGRGKIPLPILELLFFSSNFQNFNTFRPLFQKLLEINVKFHCKNVHHVKIYLPCNFEENPITHFGVVALFSSNFQNFISFVLYFKIYKKYMQMLSLNSKHVQHSMSRSTYPAILKKIPLPILELFPFFHQIFNILILFVLYFKNYKR